MRRRWALLPETWTFETLLAATERVQSRGSAGASVAELQAAVGSGAVRPYVLTGLWLVVLDRGDWQRVRA